MLAESCLFSIMRIAMELRHLRYYLVVAESLSFTKASAQLRVAQPALSRQIQDLEDEIGVDLLKRSPRAYAAQFPQGQIEWMGLWRGAARRCARLLAKKRRREEQVL